MGYALFADRKLYYQYLVNELNYQLDCVIQDRKRLLDKSSQADDWLDVVKNGSSIFDLNNPAKKSQTEAPSSNSEVLTPVKIGGESGDIAPGGQSTVTVDTQSTGGGESDKTNDEKLRYRINYNAERAYQLVSGREMEKRLAKFAKENGREMTPEEFEYESSMVNEDVAVAINKRQVRNLKNEETRLDLVQKRLESKLAIAQQNLQSVIQAEGQAIQQAAPKFAGVG